MPAKSKTEKPAASKPVAGKVEKTTGLTTPAAQPPAKTAKDLGAEKFLAKCLTSIKDVSQEDISKAVNEAWAKINEWKLQTAIAHIKARFAPSGLGNPAGAIIVGAGDAVDKDKNLLGATVYLLKDKTFINLKLLGKTVVEFDALTAGQSVVKMNAPKYTIDPASVESTPISDSDIYAAILAASIPKADIPTHEFKPYEIVAFEGKVRGFGEDYTNPLPTKNGDLKFTISPLAATEWDVAAWVHNRKFGDAYLAMLGIVELNEYRKLDVEGKADFLDSILRDQIVMVVGKVAKEPFKEYKEFKSLELDTIALLLRPDELDPVVFESRPARLQKAVTDILSGESHEQSPAEQPEQPSEPASEEEANSVAPVMKPVKLSKECLSKIDLIHKLTGKPEDVIQTEAIDLQENIVTGGNPPLEFHELLDVLIDKYQKPAPPTLAPPTAEPDYTNPEDDTPVLAQIRKVALKNKTWDLPYAAIMDVNYRRYLPGVDEKTLPESIFTAFVTANKKGGK